MSSLVPLYREMAAGGGAFRGLSILQHKAEIIALVRKHKAKTLLDYGCGAGEAWREPHRLHKELGLRWFDVQLHDPAFKHHDEPPHGRVDGVLCSDVLEHVPEDELDELVGTLYRHARLFIWASVCCRPAKKLFPDGVTNLHVTLHPLEWWRELFDKHGGKSAVEVVLTETP